MQIKKKHRSLISPVSNIFGLAKVPVRFFESHAYLTGAAAAQLDQYKRDIQ